MYIWEGKGRDGGGGDEKMMFSDGGRTYGPPGDSARKNEQRKAEKRKEKRGGFLFPFSGGKPFSCPKTQIIGVACCDTSFGVAG